MGIIINLKKVKEGEILKIRAERFLETVSGDYPGNNAKMIYFIEGHIPTEAIEKFLTEKPEIDGIALPEMPSGSPGMPGFKLFPFIKFIQSKMVKIKEYLWKFNF